MTPGDLPSFKEPVGLFPLPNAVLFPRVTLPLQVFEPRYRALVRDALADHNLIAMAMLKPGYEAHYYTNIAAISPVVCVGRIREHIQVPDGRYFINLIGVCRARIRDEDREGEYRQAMLEPLLSPHSGIETDGEFAARRTLQQMLEPAAFAGLNGVDACRALANSDAPLGEMVDMLAAALLPGDAVEVKQCLLEEVDVLQRARTLVNELQILRQAMESQQRTQQNWPRLGSMN